MIINYLSKVLYIIEKCTKQLSFLSHDVILRINLNNQLKTYYLMVKHKEISAIANTIKQLHIQKDMHMIYKQDFYRRKQN